MIEHGHAISSKPDVRLKTRRPELDREREGRHGVFLFVGSCATVSEQQLRSQNRWKTLLHAATLEACTSAEAELRPSRRLAPVFNLSGTELVFIAVLGLIVLGPEKLPGAMRKAGKIYREIRNITNNVQQEVNKVMEEPMRQVKSLVEEPASEMQKSTKIASDIFAGKMPHLQPKSTTSTATASSPQGTSGDTSPVAEAAEASAPTPSPESDATVATPPQRPAPGSENTNSEG